MKRSFRPAAWCLAAVVSLSMGSMLSGCSGRGRGGGGGGGGDVDMAGGTNMGPRTKVTQVVYANGAPMDADQAFGTSTAYDSSLAPLVYYPPDLAMIPPNLSELEVQWKGSTQTSIYEISFESTYLDLKVYSGCAPVNGGCAYLPDEPTWKLLSDQARGDTVQIVIRSSTGKGGSLGVSDTRHLSFTDEDLLGGVYYWAAANGAIARYDFGKRGQSAEQFYTPGNAGATCVGCHALSLDGKRIAVGMNIPGPAALRLLDVASKTALFTSGGFGAPDPTTGGGSNFEALSPDASKVLTSEGADLVLRDAQSGVALQAPAIAGGSMPDWSTDGTKVVFARQGGGSIPCIGGICASNPGVDQASLYLSDVSGASFGAPRLLVQGGAGNNNYYPALSPDGSLVAYNNSTMSSYDAPDAKVLVVPTAGGAPVDLTAVNGTVGNSWVKFAPFTSHYQGKTIYWLTFSSRRDYGLRIINSTQIKDNQVAQLWMVAVSPERIAQGDGGYPAFWLPFQDPKTGNHIAQWTQSVARQPCGTIEGCPSDQMCVNGECVGIPIN